MTGIRTSTIMMAVTRDGLGRKTGMAMNKFNSTGGLMSSDNRKYTGNGHVVSKNVLVMSRFPGGFFDSAGSPYYYLTDFQGNNIGVYDKTGKLVQRTDYYASGEPWLEPEYGNNASGNRYLFGGKERMAGGALNEYDFEARNYVASFQRFTTIDPEAEKFPWMSPYAYCNANPINFIDPTGGEVKGVSKKDAAMAVEDFRAMFNGDEFAKFRNLIVQSGKKQNGKSIAPISKEALTEAFDGVSLNEDQQALVDMVVNTINSSDIHKVEYISSAGVLSNQATNAFLPGFMSGELGLHMPMIIEKNGGIPIPLIINQGGGGVTTPTKDGSYSLIIIDGEHPNGRAVTTGHEIIGHGRSWATGLGDSFQHVQAIRTENLILRNISIPFINTGQNMPQKVKQQDGRTGQEKPERAVQQTDLPLYIVWASGVIPDV